ncbi:MAG: energy transducer TonB [Acidobacteriota bacterium]|nr:energy transducer TonB [Acidobacteriota bacterium]
MRRLKFVAVGIFTFIVGVAMTLLLWVHNFVPGEIFSQPVLTTPSPTRDTYLTGSVVVEMTVDKTGKVVSARAISGHPLLRPSAVQAAYQTQFTPTLFFGKPVQSRVVNTYYFGPY